MTTDDVTANLKKALGAAQVSCTDTDLDAASHDTWPVSTKLALLGRHEYRPDVVVHARGTDDIEIALSISRDTDTPITVRALGSSVTGQPLPTNGGIVLDVSRMPKTFEINERDMIVTATASYVGGELEDKLNTLGFTLGHSPQSLYRSTVGGWVSTLAIGQFSSLYGGIEDLISSFDLILPTGERVTVGQHPRAAMGPDLRRIFLGSEGTLGVITSVSLKIFPLPEVQLTEAFTIPSVPVGIELMRDITLTGIRPFLVRFYDPEEAQTVCPEVSDGHPVLFVGTQGLTSIANTEIIELRKLIEQVGGTSLGSKPVDRWMAKRFDFSGVENQLAKVGGFAETIEVAHMWSGIIDLYNDLKQKLSLLTDRVDVHFSHLYTQGTSMYVIVKGNTSSDEIAVERLREIWSTAMETCIKHGAELSHHHGGGLARSPYSRRSLGTSHKVLRRVKNALDPNSLLNPGKLGL